MATIQINNRWRIKGDSYRWHVQKYAGKRTAGDRAGEESWESIMYHATLRQAVDALAQRLIRTSEATSLEELKEVAENINLLLSSAVAAYDCE